MRIRRCDLAPQYMFFREQTLAAFDKVMASGVYVLGENVAAFEKEFAKYVGVKHCVGNANATDSLTMALQAVGVKPGDEVITTCFSAIPTLSSVLNAYAKPVLCDIDPDSFLISEDEIVKRITNKTKAILVVHLFGNVFDVESLRKRIGPDIPIVEDTAQAHGSTLRGHMAGSFGNASAFSFYPTKNLGGYGDGGAVCCNDGDLYEYFIRHRMYGMIDKDTISTGGQNSRLDEIQAAALRIKLPHLESFNQRRRDIGNYYMKHLPADKFTFQKFDKECVTNWHVFPVKYNGPRDELVNFLVDDGIQTNVYYPKPFNRQPHYQALYGTNEHFPNAESACKSILALPMYPELTDAEVKEVVDSILKFVNKHS